MMKPTYFSSFSTRSVLLLGVLFASTAGSLWGQRYEDWLTTNNVPVDASALTDRRGPFSLTNLEAYAYGLNSLTAQKSDLPRLLEVSETQLKFYYRANTLATDLHTRFQASDDFSNWEDIVPLAQTVLSQENGVEGREVLIARDAMTSTFIRHLVALVSDDPAFVNIAAGTIAEFEGYLPEVTIDQAYQIGIHEVTGGEWQQVLDWAANNGYAELGNSTAAYCNANHPVNMIDWYDAVMWCNARSEMDGLEPVYYDLSGPGEAVIYRGPKYGPYVIGDSPGSEVIHWDQSKTGYRLPTLDEWQYAARGGQLTNNSIYSGSDDLDAVAIYSDNSFAAECDLWENGESTDDRGTWPVGSKLPNELGIFDMSGNVWEMLWDPNYSGDPELLRGRRAAGGSWLFGDGFVYNFTSYQPVQTGSWLGFRLARTTFD